MTQIYKRCNEPFSQQDHYDFGTTAAKSMLTMAKRVSPYAAEIYYHLRVCYISNYYPSVTRRRIIAQGRRGQRVVCLKTDTFLQLAEEVPTGSSVIYETDLPGVDLTHPESLRSTGNSLDSEEIITPLQESNAGDMLAVPGQKSE